VTIQIHTLLYIYIFFNMDRYGQVRTTVVGVCDFGKNFQVWSGMDNGLFGMDNNSRKRVKSRMMFYIILFS